MYTYVVVFIIVCLLILFYIPKRENLAPWDIDDCKLRCYQQSQQIPWFGGPEGPWDDPANDPSANFDTAGCMARCDYLARQ